MRTPMVEHPLRASWRTNLLYPLFPRPGPRDPDDMYGGKTPGAIHIKPFIHLSLSPTERRRYLLTYLFILDCYFLHTNVNGATVIIKLWTIVSRYILFVTLISIVYVIFITQDTYLCVVCRLPQHCKLTVLKFHYKSVNFSSINLITLCAWI